MKPSLTQQFSTWGEKLLQHCDVLNDIQLRKHFRPITVQLAPTEACDSNCTYCSVRDRPKGIIPFAQIGNGLIAFRRLGAKSVEITGGGNPLLYRDGRWLIDDVVEMAGGLGYRIGVITNSESPRLFLKRTSNHIQWIRVSLAKLDEGKRVDDFDFTGLEEKLGFSYIVHSGTTKETLAAIAALVERWPTARFVRIAPDCTNDDAKVIEDRWGDTVKSLGGEKWFIKEIGENYRPFGGGCWVGAIRPYWTSTGIYICTSHVLKTRRYEPEWRLCGVDEIAEKWAEMNTLFKNGKPPYNVPECWHCYYNNNNRLIDMIAKRLPDWEFA